MSEKLTRATGVGKRCAVRRDAGNLEVKQGTGRLAEAEQGKVQFVDRECVALAGKSGKQRKPVDKLQQLTEFHWHGPRPHRGVPQRYRSFQAALLPACLLACLRL
jgi:hypothetical protein